ncbi:hypothetical protein M9H77_02819 [Catharanthus roseus]|uniref:Uncharacterized protein n=1 Tax=Catharanthus roseus TaxID=4058 RepID=A0ACC0C9J1_CATRO|nr:hypothetical protein M9H77_02819 [Catharanthus roseus]
MELTDIIIFLLFLILPWFKVMNLKLKTNLINKNCFQFVLSENASFDRLGSVEDFCPEKPVCTIIRSPKNISTVCKSYAYLYRIDVMLERGQERYYPTETEITEIKRKTRNHLVKYKTHQSPRSCGSGDQFTQVEIPKRTKTCLIEQSWKLLQKESTNSNNIFYSLLHAFIWENKFSAEFTPIIILQIIASQAIVNQDRGFQNSMMNFPYTHNNPILQTQVNKRMLQQTLCSSKLSTSNRENMNLLIKNSNASQNQITDLILTIGSIGSYLTYQISNESQNCRRDSLCHYWIFLKKGKIPETRN